MMWNGPSNSFYRGFNPKPNHLPNQTKLEISGCLADGLFLQGDGVSRPGRGGSATNMALPSSLNVLDYSKLEMK